jgi:hypothetical protein
MFGLLRQDAGGEMGEMKAAGTPPGFTDFRITL